MTLQLPGSWKRVWGPFGRQARRVTAGLSLVVVGFVAGNVLAKEASLVYQKSTLYDALMKIHNRTRANVIVVKPDASVRSFSIEPPVTVEAVKAAAKQYGKEATQIDSIYIVDAALPPDAKGGERVASARDWLARQPAGRSIVDRKVDYGLAMTAQTGALAGQLGLGRKDFANLTAQQQQMALDILRMSPISKQVEALRAVMDARSKR